MFPATFLDYRNILGPILYSQSYSDDIHTISHIKFLRPFKLSSQTAIEIHGFSDASEDGYEAVVYLKFCDSQGQHTTELIITKTRVAALKHLTIPHARA